MLQKQLLTAVVFAGLMFGTASAFADDYAVLNYRKIINESAEMKRVFNEVETMKTAMEKQLSSMDKELKAASDSLKSKSSVMSEEQIFEEKQALTAKVREYRTKEKNMSEQLSTEVRLRRKQIINILQEVVDKISEERGYNIVFEEINVHYSSDAINITAEVLNRLNAHYEKN